MFFWVIWLLFTYFVVNKIRIMIMQLKIFAKNKTGRFINSILTYPIFFAPTRFFRRSKLSCICKIFLDFFNSIGKCFLFFLALDIFLLDVLVTLNNFLLTLDFLLYYRYLLNFFLYCIFSNWNSSNYNFSVYNRCFSQENTYVNHFSHILEILTFQQIFSFFINNY